MKYAFPSLSLAFLTSCGSYYSLPDGYTGPTAIIKDTASKTGAAKAEAFQVTKIEGKTEGNSPMATPYGGGMGVTLRDSSRRVPAGHPITLTLSGGDVYAADGAALFDMISGNAKKPVSGDVVFTPKANGKYKVTGFAGQQSSSVWIEEESSGRVVTKKISN